MPGLRCSAPVSLSPGQRECERTAFSFYCAVRQQLPVWLLEEMRSMEVFCWDSQGPRAFLPSEALLYAIVHDHREYVRYLLRSYPGAALRAPACSYCCRPGGGAPHLAVAVRYDRVVALRLLLEALGELEGKRADYLDGCSGGGCLHAADAGKSAVQLAVELSHPDCLLQLLAHGARPDGLEAALQRVASCGAAERPRAQRCLDLLLLFLAEPPLPPPPCLRAEPQRWRAVLGARVFGWLCGRDPSPLLLQALRCLARSGSERISALPDFLQPHS